MIQELMHYLRDSFQFPEAMEQALFDAFWHGKKPNKSDIFQMSPHLKKLWPMLAKERGQQKQSHYSFQKELTQIYAQYYLPVNALKIALILVEYESFYSKTQSDLKCLDLGVGPGSCYWGLAWWASQLERKIKYIGLDQSKLFLAEAKRLAECLNHNLALSAEHKWHVMQKKQNSTTQILQQIEKEDPDLICFSNSIAEIFPKIEDRISLLQKITKLDCIKKSEQQKIFLLIEPAARDASRELLEFREHICAIDAVDCLLPCFSKRKCGALAKENDWCHEAVHCDFPDWLNQLGDPLGLQKNSTLFSYLLLSLNGKKEQKMEDSKRVVSQLMKRKGFQECFLCMPEGKKQNIRISKRNPAQEELLANLHRGQVLKRVEISIKKELESYQTVKNINFPYGQLFPKK